MNMPLQGTAADIIKIAMVRVDERLKREGLEARLILQVHDELLIESPLNEIFDDDNFIDSEFEKSNSELDSILNVDINIVSTDDDYNLILSKAQKLDLNIYQNAPKK